MSEEDKALVPLIAFIFAAAVLAGGKEVIVPACYDLAERWVKEAEKRGYPRKPMP